MFNLSLVDKLILKFDQGIKGFSDQKTSATRSNPALQIAESPLTEEEKRRSIGFMRVNHAGEVSAQALYDGQSWVARSQPLKQELTSAADEEQDHLQWCAERIHELGGRTSYLNPFWYLGSLALGASAGLFGDNISLGFLAETERQVTAHLTRHLKKLPEQDYKSRAIVTEMRIDECKHAIFAETKGGSPLPLPARLAMKLMSRVMTTVAYWI